MTTLCTLAAFVLLVGAVTPALILAARGDAADRLVGLELSGSVAALVLTLLALGYDQTSYLIVPLVLALLSFAGALVYTRLLGPRP